MFVYCVFMTVVMYIYPEITAAPLVCGRGMMLRGIMHQRCLFSQF